jgi:hypothetical protein
MIKEKFEDKSNKIRYKIMLFFSMYLTLFGFFIEGPKKAFSGLLDIMRSPGILITDYIGVGGIGATFLNSGLITLISLFILYKLRLRISGVSIASVFLMSGFALFGKNIFNIWLILIGVFIYSKLQKDNISKYVYIGFFGTSLAPAVSEMLFSIGQPLYIRLFLSIGIGLTIGIILPPLSAYLLRVHQGFNLYNIGFTAGIIGTIFVGVLKANGYAPQPTLIWSTGNNIVLSIFLTGLFIIFILIGYFYNDKSFKGYTKIFNYSGRLVTDFISLEGFGLTLINMGVVGFIAMGYVLLVNGDLNGPTIGGILSIVGFGAFGKHPKNIIPIFIGVAIASLTNTVMINEPSMLFAALFGTALAPLAGQFGFKVGILAGFINSSVVLNVGILHNGLNLYNTGFSSGIVAAFLIPIIEAFRKEE